MMMSPLQKLESLLRVYQQERDNIGRKPTIKPREIALAVGITDYKTIDMLNVRARYYVEVVRRRCVGGANPGPFKHGKPCAVVTKEGKLLK